MKNTSRKFIVLCLIISSYASAQTEGTLFFMNSLPQVVYVNPAFVPKYKISVGLPGSSIMTGFSNNGFKVKDFISKENGIVTANLNNLYSNLKDKNYITQSAQIDLLRVSLRVNSKLYLTYNSSIKIFNRLMLPKDIMGILVEGTTPFIGSSANAAPKIESLAWMEHAVGGAYSINDKLKIGARVKLLSGIVNATTKNSELKLAVDNDTYAITMSGSMDVRTSGIQNIDRAQFGNIFKNTGFGIDVGATYQLLKKLSLSASITDLGFIKWKNDTYGYTLDKATAKYTFKGIDLGEVFNGNSSYLNSVGDSIQKNFEPKEGVIGSYKSSTPTKIYAGGTYEIVKNFSAGVVLHSEMFRGRTSAGATLGVVKNFGKWFTLSGTYTMANNSYNNIGLGTSLNLSPFQFYLVGDNVLRMAFSGKEINNFVNSTKQFNIRAGLNIVFKWDKGEPKGSYNQNPETKKRNKKQAGLRSK